MGDPKRRVYCAGPLFNDKEREEMQDIATALEEGGYETFLPHRDGFEFTPLLPMLMMHGLTLEKATALWDRAIFAIDAYQAAVSCDALVVNLNGRVPDEGAVAEAAMAWANGKAVAAYKDDLRSLVGGKDNAMVVGLSDFKTYANFASLIDALQAKLSLAHPPAITPTAAMKLGERLWAAKTGPEGLDAVVALMLEDTA